MGAFGEIFESQQAGAVPMAAPGLPLAALSGNPAATVTNIAAISGANAGNMFGNAVQSAVGAALNAPMVDPMAMAMQRQQAFVDKYNSNVASGMLQGEAMVDAADSGFLAPNQQLKAKEAGLAQLEKDRGWIKESVKTVNSDARVKDYREARATMDGILQQAGQDFDTVSDFFLIQQGLKVIDPTSITSQNEINSAFYRTQGFQDASRIFGQEGVNLNLMMRFFAGKGELFTLNERQKRAWVRGLARIMDAKQSGALTAASEGREYYLAGGGTAPAFDRATSWVGSELETNWNSIAESMKYGQGNAPDGQFEMYGMAGENMPEMQERIAEAGAIVAKATGTAVKAGISGLLESADAAAEKIINMEEDEAVRLVQRYAPQAYLDALRQRYDPNPGPMGGLNESALLAIDKNNENSVAKNMGIDYAKSLIKDAERLEAERRKRRLDRNKRKQKKPIQWNQPRP